MLLAAKDKDSTEERLKAAKEALLVYKEVLLTRLDANYEDKIPVKLLLHWIDSVLEKDDFYVAHEFLEDINDPFYFTDFNAMLVKNELVYLCEYGLEDLFLPYLGINQADSYKDKKFKDRIDLEQFIDIVNNKVFRQSLIVHAKAYESVANKQIGPSDVNKIHVVADFVKKDDGWHDKFALMPQDISWLCEVFYKMYPASINLSQILEMLKTNLTGYIKYFLNHNDNADITFANKFGLLDNLNLVDYYVFILLDGKNSLEYISSRTLKFIKEKNIQTLEVDGKKLTKDVVIANIMRYVTDTAKLASMLYLLEEI